MAEKYKTSIESEMGTDDFQSWGKQKVSTYQEIVLKQFEKCREEGSKQMIGGGQFYQRGETGNFQAVHLFDQRRIYAQAVITLYDLMSRYFDTKARKNITGRLNKIELRKKELLSQFINLEPRDDLKQLAKVTGEISKTKVGSQILEFFEGYKYEQYRKVFRQLTLLYDRKNELSSKRKVSTY